jgi:hypothetical protein
MISLSVNSTHTNARGPAPLARILPDEVQLVCPEQFGALAEAEAQRHARYLRGYGILRIAPRSGRLGADALREALQTEVRRTDVVCPYPDGSAALLVREAGREALETIARRLEFVAREIATEAGAPEPEYVSGAAVAEDRRLGADELWLAADQAMEASRDEGAEFVMGRWH